jgi:GNAT superfamily N-acetyltransferase
MQIRFATPNDATIIADFNKAMALETENKILNDDTILQGAKNLISQPQYGFYIVAEIDNKIVGSLMITYEWSDWRNGIIWWLQSVYVSMSHRQQSVFKNMLSFVEQQAAAKKSVGIRLYMEKENLKASKTYTQCGFTQSDYLIFEKLTA